MWEHVSTGIHIFKSFHVKKARAIVSYERIRGDKLSVRIKDLKVPIAMMESCWYTCQHHANIKIKK